MRFNDSSVRVLTVLPSTGRSCAEPDVDVADAGASSGAPAAGATADDMLLLLSTMRQLLPMQDARAVIGEGCTLVVRCEGSLLQTLRCDRQES